MRSASMGSWCRTNEVRRQSRSISRCVIPLFLATHPSLPILYVVEELSAGEGGGLVSAFSWNGSGFSRLSRQSSLGEDPCHLSISPDGQLLAAANYSSGSVVVFKLDDDGRIH